MARYKVIGYIEAGHSMWFDEERREVRTLRPSDCQQPISGYSTACNMSLITGDEVDPDTGEVWWGSGRGRSEYFAKVFKYPPKCTIPVGEDDLLELPKSISENVGASLIIGLKNEVEDGKTPVMSISKMSFGKSLDKPGCVTVKMEAEIKREDVEPDQEPKYGESAMTSEAIGGKVKPKLEWKVERIWDETKGRQGKGFFRVNLFVDATLFAKRDISRPEAGELSERQSRKLEKKIEAAKAGIMRTYLLTVRQSGPVNGGL